MFVMAVAVKQEAIFKDPWKNLFYESVDISGVSPNVLRLIFKFAGWIGIILKLRHISCYFGAAICELSTALSFVREERLGGSTTIFY